MQPRSCSKTLRELSSQGVVQSLSMASLERPVAVETARTTGHLLLRELSNPRRIAYKGTPTNLVTEMDARAEALIVERLLARFPDDGILAEERGTAPGRSGHR